MVILISTVRFQDNFVTAFVLDPSSCGASGNPARAGLGEHVGGRHVPEHYTGYILGQRIVDCPWLHDGLAG